MIVSKPKIKKPRHWKSFFYMAIVVIIALAIEIGILALLNKTNSQKNSTILLNQVDRILKDNTVNINELISSLKDEYIVRAQIVAYVLDSNPSAVYDQNELKKIARLTNIDEIHIFNDKGSIYSGTVPKYYGYNFDSGEQMAFFKPMLKDKSRTMCQDITPNTAEGKSMMYAITWNKDGNKMIQIGIEPVRLLEKLKSNEVSNLIRDLPTYDEMEVYVADTDSERILGTTDRDAVGKSLSEIKLHFDGLQYFKEYCFPRSLKGYLNYVSVLKGTYYTIAIANSTQNKIERFIVILLIELVYLTIAGLVIAMTLNKLLSINHEKNEQLAVLSSITDIYYTMHVIDLKKDETYEYSSTAKINGDIDWTRTATEIMKQVMMVNAAPEYLDSVLEFTNLLTLPERMKNKKTIAMEFIGVSKRWFSAAFVRIDSDAEGRPEKVIFVTQLIDGMKRKEQYLIKKSNTDELTGLYNRHAYENDVSILNNSSLDENLVYVSLDVNGLKIINDNQGHAAGDELLLGAVSCMKKTFGELGKLYRTGGDEFVAIISADSEKLEEVKKSFEATCAAWSGKLVDKVAVSCGYVALKEVPGKTIHKISLLADKRMYEEKSAFYRRNGVDRRGQKEAHTALCALYTKILKINITDDTYQIVNMDEEEQTKEKGFDDKISKWLENFGTSGQVHPDDLEDYLAKSNLGYMRRYFSRNKNSLTLFYRRKYGDKYKQVMMEIIPASDYTNENQNLFLYVKNIDR